MTSSEIIRLQNLPITAKAADIRRFFANVSIPRGAVNICGDPMVGDAFIRFANENDAQMAMKFDRMILHNSIIRLQLSSANEMEKVMNAARTSSLASFAATFPVKAKNTEFESAPTDQIYSNPVQSNLNSSNSAMQNSLSIDKNWKPPTPNKLEGIILSIKYSISSIYQFFLNLTKLD